MNRNGASRPVRRRQVGLAFLAVFLAFAPGTMSAQSDTDRSLNADNKPATEPGEVATAQADGNIAPVSHPDMTPQDTATQDAKNPAGDPNANPDLSNLTREQLEARVKTLTESLAAANAESELFRQQWQDLKLRDEALGVDALTGDQSKLNDKVVQAVKELYQSEMKRREAMVLLDKLLSTTAEMIQSAPKYDPKVRAEYEVASRAAKEKLKGTFILQRIAEAEKVTVTAAEMRARVASMAARYGMTAEKATRELEKRNSMDRVAEDILSGKVIDFLVANASVRVADAAGEAR
ncbi:MAG: hypothetical protein LV479_03755 [Methylacidiphilales bacterium]|nr:hypothetical protein [Candidatus Methylacidiphilales bacterium]